MPKKSQKKFSNVAQKRAKNFTLKNFCYYFLFNYFDKLGYFFIPTSGNTGHLFYIIVLNIFNPNVLHSNEMLVFKFCALFKIPKTT